MPNVWDKACRPELVRDGQKLDRGVNFFVAMLDQLGLRTLFSCEGHPGGFYVTFTGPYRTGLKIKRCGFLSVEVEAAGHWSIRIHGEERGPKEHVDHLRWAAEAWEKRLGPLKFNLIKKSLNHLPKRSMIAMRSQKTASDEVRIIKRLAKQLRKKAPSTTS